MLVTVVIPTYNRADFLPDAIDSALAQTHREIEVIVVDDGSTDGTEELMARRYSSNPLVRYFRQRNSGVATARNRGITEGRGELIAFLDSDDLWFPEKLRIQIAILSQLPEAGMLWTDMQAISPEGRMIHERHLRRMYGAYRFFPTMRDLFSEEHSLDKFPDLAKLLPADTKVYCGNIFSQMVLGNLAHTSTAVIRRSRIDVAGLFREDFRVGEDHDFFLRMSKAGPVAFADIVTIGYRVNMSDALTAMKRLEFAEAFLRSLEENLASARDAITLPKKVIDDCLCAALGWVAVERFMQKRYRGGMRCLIGSLRRNPYQPALMKSVLRSLIPPGLQSALARPARSLRTARMAR